MHQFLNIFQKYILILENKNVLCFELNDVIKNLLTDLTRRKNDKFFGFKCTEGLRKLLRNEKQKAENKFLA